MTQEDFNRNVSRSLGRIEGKLDSLCGDEGRISALEKDRVRQWWFSAVFAPILVALHALLRYFKPNV